MIKVLFIICLLVVSHHCAQSQGQSQDQNSNSKPNNKPSNNSTSPATTTTPSTPNKSPNATTTTTTTTSTVSPNNTTSSKPTTPSSSGNTVTPSTPTTSTGSTTTVNSTSKNSTTSASSSPSTPPTTSSTASPSASPTTSPTTSSTASPTASSTTSPKNQPVPTNQNNSSKNATPWFAAKLLELHNNEKALVGQANYGYTWSDSLYKSAQSWADYLASSYNFYHSGTAGVGENIATATIRNTDMVSMMFGFWSAEKKFFMPWKRFPDCSTTGNWGDVAHYTQIVWGMSTEVGCGLGINTNNNVLVCQYSLPGNYIGNYVYINDTKTN